MPVLTPDQRASLMSDIEEVVLAGRWGTKAKLALAHKYGTDQSAVTKHYNNWVAMRRHDADGKTFDEKRAETWAQWEQAFDIAAAKKDPNAMARLLRVKSSWLNMDHAPRQTEPTRVEIVPAPGTTPPDSATLAADLDALPVTVLLASLDRRRQGDTPPEAG